MNLSADIEKNDATAPEKAGVVVDAQVLNKTQQKQEQSRLPAFIKVPLDWFNGVAKSARNGTIHALPARIVNNSSNVIGVTQLMGEAMMFKANGTIFIPEITDPIKKAAVESSAARKIFYNVTSPFVSIYKSIFSAEGSKKFEFKELLKGKFWTEEVGQFFNVEKAALRDSQLGKARLINRWQARSTFAGLAGMTIAALMPDVKDTKEDIDQRMDLRQNSPIKYTIKTLGEAVWFPIGTAWEVGKKVVTLGQAKTDEDVGKYKRQFTGMALTIAGICSFLSGFRNVKGNVVGNQAYAFNWAHSTGGAITAVAGSQLLMAVGSEQGWARFGAIQWARLLTLPESIGKRYKKDAQGRQDPGRHYYFAGQGFLQGANTESALFGGAQVDEKGNIIDTKAVRDEAKRKAKEHHDTNKHGHEDNDLADAPANTLAKVEHREAAMPERVAAHEAGQAELAAQ